MTNNSELSNTAATRTASVLNVIAGIWLIISPFALGYANPGLRGAEWDTVVIGIVVAVLAWIRAANPLHFVGLSWINFVLGIWLLISPFVLRYSAQPTAMWNDVIMGIIVIVLSICSAAATRSPAVMSH